MVFVKFFSPSPRDGTQSTRRCAVSHSHQRPPKQSIDPHPAQPRHLFTEFRSASLPKGISAILGGCQPRLKPSHHGHIVADRPPRVERECRRPRPPGPGTARTQRAVRRQDPSANDRHRSVAEIPLARPEVREDVVLDEGHELAGRRHRARGPSRSARVVPGTRAGRRVPESHAAGRRETAGYRPEGTRRRFAQGAEKPVENLGCLGGEILQFLVGRFPEKSKAMRETDLVLDITG